MSVRITIINESENKVPKNFTRKISELFFDYLTKNKIIHEIILYTFSIVYIAECEMLDYNREYRNKDISTDVLSFCANNQFDITDNKFLTNKREIDLGDILVSNSNVVNNSIRHGIDQREELARVLVHGILHLLGFDHKGEINSLEEMYRIQEEFINTIKKKEKII